MKRHLASILVALAACASATARADVEYDFSGLGLQESFSLSLPDFITGDTSFRLGQLGACRTSLGICGGVEFLMDGAAYGAPGTQVIGFNVANLDGAPPSTNLFYFRDGDALPFATPGTHHSTGNVGTLKVFEAVPEPKTEALIVAGLAMMAFMTRRRRRS